MNSRKTQRAARILAQTALCCGALVLGACGGEMPFTGKIKVAGEGPPPPPPPPEPEAPKRVEVLADKIQINEKIQFEVAKANIKEESHDLLNEIVQVIKDNPHIKKIRIEGHASSEGADDFNMRLSDDRAKAVKKYLVDNGLDEDRLVAKGYGETQPLDSNDTEAGREKNRRVEFNIVEQDRVKQKVEIDPKTGEKKVLENQVVDESEGKPSLAKPKKPKN